MFNLALQYKMPYDWTINWVKPQHKGCDVNNVENCRTIMASSMMGKLLGSVIEMKLSGWAYINDKRAYGEAGFHCAHSAIDHLVT